jgi:hypothetical protein
MNFWRDKVANPDALGSAEKKLWGEIEPLLDGLLSELKANGKIETVYTEAETKKLVEALDKLDRFSLAHNALISLFKPPDPKIANFLKVASEFGFDGDKTAYLCIAMEAIIEVLSTELFKLVVLFHMKDVDFSVSKFSRTIESAAPKSWPSLKPYVDNAFRNSLAHGTYSATTNKVVLFENAKLVPSNDLEAEMSLDRFMIRAKTQNVLYHCLVHLLAEKTQSGFFAP